MAQVEQKQAYYHRYKHADADNQRRAYIVHKCSRHQEDEYKGQYQVLLQVGDGVVQQLGLILGNIKSNVRIGCLEIADHIDYRLLHAVHGLIRLLDDRQHDGTFAIVKTHPAVLLGQQLDLGQLLQLVDPTIFPQVHISDVVHRAHDRRKLDVVLVIPFAHRHAPRLDVVVG